MGNSPVQFTPSPLYPWLQVQVKLPGVLVHSALASQLLPPVLHSSISNITDDNKHGCEFDKETHQYS